MYFNQKSILAADYLRLSREDGDKLESDSIRNQRSLINDFVKQHKEIQLVEEYIHRMRMGSGFETLQRSSSVLKGIIRRIREGKVMAMLPDVRSRTPGVVVQFLGKPASKLKWGTKIEFDDVMQLISVEDAIAAFERYVVDRS